MHVTDERLTAVLTRSGDRNAQLRKASPVAALVLETMAAAHPGDADSIRDAGLWLLDLLGGTDEGGLPLRPAVAMQVLTREELTSSEEMRSYLDKVASRDLLLGISTSALLSKPSFGRRRRRARRSEDTQQAALRTVYLLVRMIEAQEEVDALHEAFDI